MLVFWDENGSILSDKEIIQQKLEKYGWISNRIKEFNQNYDILAQKSGYSGTIVRNKHTNEIIVAHRGTETDSSKDLLQDGILALAGLPYSQATDAKAFIDNAIKSGLIKGNFRNVDHSLGHAIATVVHLTTNNSSGATGFNIK
ncbi:hypothetical protein F480_07645 [Bibersteinia trehalosi Y31]|uniref:DUF6792 domain-containing protein n=1 Tax=Bibersteinia trehalosi Y31 TaxID=1261658 RepID=A0A179CYE6_BIBTR|nr:DUF6792 domain-containing protein [Bibersteinia trehalosi]OAQ14919.1 hypothetical protein F480_07645 [Bibersteinia trehalosi Y31]